MRFPEPCRGISIVYLAQLHFSSHVLMEGDSSHFFSNGQKMMAMTVTSALSINSIELPCMTTLAGSM